MLNVLSVPTAVNPLPVTVYTDVGRVSPVTVSLTVT